MRKISGSERNPIRKTLCADYTGKRLCAKEQTPIICGISTARLYFYSYNITAISQNADYYLYTAADKETLSELWNTLLTLSRTYFSSLTVCEDTDIVFRVDRYLEQHYQNPSLTVQDAAHDLGFTNTYLCTAYKKSCGKTINQHLTQLRILHAKELLAGSTQKLYEVARNVGYANGKYFTKLFTRETGLSPKEYRERHRNET